MEGGNSQTVDHGVMLSDDGVSIRYGEEEADGCDEAHMEQFACWKKRSSLRRMVSSSEPEDGQRGSSSLPSTPPRRRRNVRGGGSLEEPCPGENTYASENESGMRVRRRSGNKRSVVMITRPKGGRRSLCMDMEEVRACKDLGFELEHEKMMEILPGQVTLSASTIDSTSDDTSPIATWHVSSLDDDPRDVKAKLKMWAQAVAIATTSRNGGI